MSFVLNWFDDEENNKITASFTVLGEDIAALWREFTNLSIAEKIIIITGVTALTAICSYNVYYIIYDVNYWTTPYERWEKLKVRRLMYRAIAGEYMDFGHYWYEAWPKDSLKYCCQEEPKTNCPSHWADRNGGRPIRRPRPLTCKHILKHAKGAR